MGKALAIACLCLLGLVHIHCFEATKSLSETSQHEQPTEPFTIQLLQNDEEEEKQNAGELQEPDDPNETQTLPQPTGDTGGDSDAPPSDPAEQKQQAEYESSQATSAPGDSTNESSSGSGGAGGGAAGGGGPAASSNPADRVDNPDNQKQKKQEAAESKKDSANADMMKGELDGSNSASETAKADEKIQVVQSNTDMMKDTTPTPTPAPPIIEVMNETATSLNPKCHIVKMLVCDNDTETESATIAVTPSTSVTPSPVPLVFPENWENPDWSKTLYSPSPSPSFIPEPVPGRDANEVTQADRTRLVNLIESVKHHIVRKKNSVASPALKKLVSPSGPGEKINFPPLEKRNSAESSTLLAANAAKSKATKTLALQLLSQTQKVVPPPANDVSAVAFGNDAEADFMLEDPDRQERHHSMYPATPLQEGATNMKLALPGSEPGPSTQLHFSEQAVAESQTALPMASQEAEAQNKMKEQQMIQSGFSGATLGSLLRGSRSSDRGVYERGISRSSGQEKDPLSRISSEMVKPNPAEEKIMKDFDYMIHHGLPSVITDQMNPKIQKKVLEEQTKQVREYFEEKKKELSDVEKARYTAPPSPGLGSMFGLNPDGPNPWEMKAPEFSQLRQGISETMYDMFHSDILARGLTGLQLEEGAGESNMDDDDDGVNNSAGSYEDELLRSFEIEQALLPSQNTIAKSHASRHHSGHGTRPIIDQSVEYGGDLQVGEDGTERMKMDKCGEWVWELDSPHCKRPGARAEEEKQSEQAKQGEEGKKADTPADENEGDSPASGSSGSGSSTSGPSTSGSDQQPLVIEDPDKTNNGEVDPDSEGDVPVTPETPGTSAPSKEGVIPVENFPANAPPPEDSEMIPPTLTPSPSASVSYSPTASLSVGATPSTTPSASRTPSISSSFSPTRSLSATMSYTPSTTRSPSFTSSPGSPPSSTQSATSSLSVSSSPSPSATPSPSKSAVALSPGASPSASVSATPTITRTPTSSPSPSLTPTPQPSLAPGASRSSSPTISPSPTASPKVSTSPKASPQASASPQPSPKGTKGDTPVAPIVPPAEDCCNFDNQPEKREIFEEGFSKGYDTGFDSGIKIAFKDIQAGVINAKDMLMLDDQGRPLTMSEEDAKEPWEKESAFDQEPPNP